VLLDFESFTRKGLMVDCVCQQKINEDPTDYLQCWRAAFKKYLGMTEEKPKLLPHTFVNGRNAKFQAGVKQLCVGWEGQTFVLILPIVTHRHWHLEKRSAEVHARLIYSQDQVDWNRKNPD